MGLRFRRRIRIAKGLYVNVSKSGVSASVGGHGATVNLSRRGARTTVGLPGSGLSYRSPTRPWSASSGAGRLRAVAILAAAQAVVHFRKKKTVVPETAVALGELILAAQRAVQARSRLIDQ